MKRDKVKAKLTETKMIKLWQLNCWSRILVNCWNFFSTKRTRKQAYNKPNFSRHGSHEPWGVVPAVRCVSILAQQSIIFLTTSEFTSISGQIWYRRGSSSRTWGLSPHLYDWSFCLSQASWCCNLSKARAALGVTSERPEHVKKLEKKREERKEKAEENKLKMVREKAAKAASKVHHVPSLVWWIYYNAM